jgi:hypothetical protein
MSTIFSVVYVILAPLIFPFLKKRYFCLVQFSIILIVVGCIGRYLSRTAYLPGMIWTAVGAVGHVALVTAPYAIIPLF